MIGCCPVTNSGIIQQCDICRNLIGTESFYISDARSGNMTHLCQLCFADYIKNKEEKDKEE